MSVLPYTENQWVRVSRAQPCCICGKPDWCLIAADGSAAICPRIESGKRCGDGGYLHVLAEKPRFNEPRRVIVTIRASPPDLTEEAMAYQHAVTIEQLRTFAALLEVITESLTAFSVGWSADHRAWSFPMFDPQSGKVIGIRLRRPDGVKFSVKGGKESLFVPRTLTDADPVVLVTEGASDAIAAHSIGLLNSIGRPSCTGGTQHLVAMVKTRKPALVVIVSDNDKPGIRGANTLAGKLSLHCRDVRVITPPSNFKDLRQWVASGATRADLEQLIQLAEIRRHSFKIITKGKNDRDGMRSGDCHRT